MTTKTFSNKKITIRALSQKDLKLARKFRDFINSFIKEDAQVLMNKKFSLKRRKRMD